MNTNAAAPRTTRDFDGAFATGGAVRQSGGSLPIYTCNACQGEVVWATSTRTGRKYLVNVSRGYNGNRFYIGSNVHKCAETQARLARFETTADAAVEANREAAYDDMAADAYAHRDEDRRWLSILAAREATR